MREWLPVVLISRKEGNGNHFGRIGFIPTVPDDQLRHLGLMIVDCQLTEPELASS